MWFGWRIGGETAIEQPGQGQKDPGNQQDQEEEKQPPWSNGW
jgi:hypothetical protein